MCYFPPEFVSANIHQIHGSSRAAYNLPNSINRLKLLFQYILSVTWCCRCDNVWCSRAETVISVLQIPLQLKLLHPQNRGIHGYITSHVKGCLSQCICILQQSPPFFPSFIISKKTTVPPQGLAIMVFLYKWYFQRNNFNDIDEDRTAIKYLCIMNASHIISAVTCSTLRDWNAEALWFSATEAAGWNIGASLSATYLQSSEQLVTLTTQFYHSSPLLPSLTAGINCALNVYCCKILHLKDRLRLKTILYLDFSKGRYFWFVSI